MGGSVAVVVRDKDGVVYKQGRWTNGLSTCFNDVRLFQGDHEFLMEYLNRESAYGPWDNVAPMGYGLVLCDMQTKTLIDLQGYTAQLGGKFYNFCFEWHHYGSDEDPRVQDEEVREQAEAFSKAGLLRVVRLVTYGSKGEQARDVPVTTLAEVDKVAKDHDCRARRAEGDKRPSDEHFRFLICDILGWTYIRFEESKKGLDEMKAKVLSLGFKLTEADEAEWANYAKDRFEEDE